MDKEDKCTFQVLETTDGKYFLSPTCASYCESENVWMICEACEIALAPYPIEFHDKRCAEAILEILNEED